MRPRPKRAAGLSWTLSAAIVEKWMEEAEAEIATLRTQLDAWREREARCCPEDVGFEEVIAALRAQIKRMEGVVEEARGAVEAWNRADGYYDPEFKAIEVALAALDAGKEEGHEPPVGA